RNPGARLVAIGCYAQRAPRELSRIEFTAQGVQGDSGVPVIHTATPRGIILARLGPVKPAG
ncbi:hypothetical protein ACFLS8_04100, partial [Chloroflexota bacterium]